MTDPGTADRTYIGPMNAELVDEILEKVRMTQLTEYRFKRTTAPLHALFCRSDQMLSYPPWAVKLP